MPPNRRLVCPAAAMASPLRILLFGSPPFTTAQQLETFFHFVSLLLYSDLLRRRKLQTLLSVQNQHWFDIDRIVLSPFPSIELQYLCWVSLVQFSSIKMRA